MFHDSMPSGIKFCYVEGRTKERRGILVYLLHQREYEPCFITYVGELGIVILPPFQNDCPCF